MTNQTPDEDRTLAARLRKALAASDTLSHAAAQALLPDLVAAEQAGVDVDADPAFVALLRHLDQCDADCLVLYEELSEGIAALDPAEQHAPVSPPASVPTFFPTAPSLPRRVVRLLQERKRGFVLEIPLPRPLPLVGTLGSRPQATVFNEALPEVAGSPTVTVTIQAQGKRATVRVAVREADLTSRWRIDLQAGTFTASSSSDQGGSATFTHLQLKDLEHLELAIAEEED